MGHSLDVLGIGYKLDFYFSDILDASGFFPKSLFSLGFVLVAERNRLVGHVKNLDVFDPSIRTAETEPNIGLPN